ncbi:MAG: putative ABC transport system permease protein [Bacillota bacterium]|nr:MAG: putative ABC transport system permease protein [Bacillota bacterium]
MRWLLLVVLRRNLKKYALASIPLMLSVTVSCLGLAGVTLMWNIAKYPMLQVIGGDVMVVSRDIKFFSVQGGVGSDGSFEPFHLDEVRELIVKAMPKSKVTGSLVVPAILNYGDNKTASIQLLGRENDTGNWLFSPRFVAGTLPKATAGSFEISVPGHQGGSVWGTVGNEIFIRPMVYSGAGAGDVDAWDYLRSSLVRGRITGIIGPPSLGGFMWTDFNSLREHAASSNLVHWAGIVLPDSTMLQKESQKLAEVFASAMPTLKVVTVDELGELFISDFIHLRRAAAYYVPVMLFLSVQIVVATALALAISRRRELAVLKTLGLSHNQLYLLFIFECLTISFLSALLGLLLSKVLAQALFNSMSVSSTPVVVTVAVTVLVSSIVTFYSFKTRVVGSLRNS